MRSHDVDIIIDTRHMLTLALGAVAQPPPPIIGGQGDFKYQYMPGRLQAPPGAGIVECATKASNARQALSAERAAHGRER